MIPKSGDRFPAFAKRAASAGEARSDQIMRKQALEMLGFSARVRLRWGALVNAFEVW
jgi:hypothetical protein